VQVVACGTTFYFSNLQSGAFGKISGSKSLAFVTNVFSILLGNAFGATFGWKLNLGCGSTYG